MKLCLCGCGVEVRQPLRAQSKEKVYNTSSCRARHAKQRKRASLGLPPVHTTYIQALKVTFESSMEQVYRRMPVPAEVRLGLFGI